VQQFATSSRSKSSTKKLSGEKRSKKQAPHLETASAEKPKAKKRKTPEQKARLAQKMAEQKEKLAQQKAHKKEKLAEKKEKLAEKKAEQKEKKAAQRERKAERNQEKKVELSEKKERARERSRNRKLKLKEKEEHMLKKLKERATKFVDPARPKKPLVPYILYVQENQAAVKAANKTLTITQVMSKVGQNWKALSVEQKQPYVERFEKNLKEYREAVAAFDAANPIPKRPATIFSLFVKQQFAAHPEAKSRDGAREVLSNASKEWKALPTKEKEKLKKEYRVHLAEYRQSLSSWTESQVDKLPQSVREFAREALKTGKFNKPREVQLLVSDLSKVATAREAEA
jgi:hypothetical protein